jgi:hypothetical protein
MSSVIEIKLTTESIELILDYLITKDPSNFSKLYDVPEKYIQKYYHLDGGYGFFDSMNESKKVYYLPEKEGDILHNTFDDILEKEFGIEYDMRWEWESFIRKGIVMLEYTIDYTDGNFKIIKKLFKEEFAKSTYSHRRTDDSWFILKIDMEELLNFIIKREPNIINKIESIIPDYLKDKYVYLGTEYGFFDTVNEQFSEKMRASLPFLKPDDYFGCFATYINDKFSIVKEYINLYYVPAKDFYIELYFESDTNKCSGQLKPTIRDILESIGLRFNKNYTYKTDNSDRRISSYEGNKNFVTEFNIYYNLQEIKKFVEENEEFFNMYFDKIPKELLPPHFGNEYGFFDNIKENKYISKFENFNVNPQSHF